MVVKVEAAVAVVEEDFSQGYIQTQMINVGNAVFWGGGLGSLGRPGCLGDCEGLHLIDSSLFCYIQTLESSLEDSDD